MIMKRTLVLALAFPVLLLVLAEFSGSESASASAFHHPAELAFLKKHWPQLIRQEGHFPLTDPTGALPIDSNILFPTSRTCSGCHGLDSTGLALVTSSGQDVNIYDDWRSTMMANSARDPFWRAKVTHEILVNPSHSLELQDKCTSCHAPAGHYQAKLKRKQTHYTLYEMYADTLGLDGVTCQACHAQAPNQLGSLHSGELYFDTNYIRVAYGPYDVPFVPPMRDFVGITPLYGAHMGDAGLCAGCHTLITNTVDLSGAFTGGTFIEQATYHEWLNSRYDDDHGNITCQGCHIPQLLDEIIISANYQFLTPQFPFGVHELAGANVTMLELMKANLDKLGIPATEAQFDSTIAATLRMLQQKTLDLELVPRILDGDTAYFDLKLVNKAGHKFPSGYPARRAWVEFEVKNASGETVFHSGRYDPEFRIQDEDANFEPHYDVINHPEQVQIYEMVPGDVAGNFTNVLERGAFPLKDNRLVPQGFLRSDPVYDTTQIIGRAGTDADFNLDGSGTEGSGSDVLHFHIPINGYTGTFSVSAKIWYQSLPPKWMDPMFAVSTPEIDSFRVMFDAADRSPVLIGTVSLEDLPVSPVSTKAAVRPAIAIVPTFTSDGRVRVVVPSGTRLAGVRAWNAAGQLVWEGNDSEVRLPVRRGVYFVEALTSHGRAVVKVVVH
ncbi:MAG: hypothetical protein EP344_13910 [Bacteroidetes bacterium]|nr:MAG: hypothetical protein EP344_13910 [Bacteroidota bacterium]